MKHRNRGVELQTRDLDILKFIYAQRIVTFAQIRRKFFSQSHKANAARRIRKLQKDNFLEFVSVFRNNKDERCCLPTVKGYEQVKDQWKFRLHKQLVKSESHEHDIRLTEMLMKLESLRCFGFFFSENLLQSSDDLAGDSVLADFVKIQSDGVLVVVKETGEQGKYPFEMEISSKGVNRYKEKIASYYLARRLAGVLYICASQEIINAVAEADKAVRGQRESILHFTLEKNALAENGKVTFINEKRQTLVMT